MQTLSPARVRRGAGATLVALLLLVACSPAAGTGPAPVPTTPVSPPAGPPSEIIWTSCGERLECARVPVPLDWDEPTGEMISLGVIRHPASKPNQRIGTIFTDPGGPGDTGVGLVRDGGDELDAWGGGRFDWIGWDPRGTHASSPVTCFTSEREAAAFWKDVSVPSTDAESTAFARRTTELAQRCGTVLGTLLSNISTEDTVRDLDRMRELIGEEQLNYVGLSYGTVIGQVYANLFPDRVRAMMLDGLVDVTAYTSNAERRTLVGTSSTDAVLEQFLALCDSAGPKRCALTGDGQTAGQRYAALRDRVRRDGPLPAPKADPPGRLSYSDFLITSYSPLRDPELWPDYAKQLRAGADGDVSALATSAALWRTPQSWAEVVKSSAISCLDGPADQPVEDWRSVIGELADRNRLSGAVQGWWLWAPCASNWPVEGAHRYVGPWDAKTATPILLIGTRYDPATGYRNAVNAQRYLGNAVLLTHDGYGHLSMKDPSACVEAARVRYLVELKLPASGTVCEPDQVPFR